MELSSGYGYRCFWCRVGCDWIVLCGHRNGTFCILSTFFFYSCKFRIGLPDFDQTLLVRARSRQSMVALPADKGILTMHFNGNEVFFFFFLFLKSTICGFLQKWSDSVERFGWWIQREKTQNYYTRLWLWDIEKTNSEGGLLREYGNMVQYGSVSSLFI